MAVLGQQYWLPHLDPTFVNMHMRSDWPSLWLLVSQDKRNRV